jgi:hypothetical protein
MPCWAGTASSIGTVLEPAPNKGWEGLLGGWCTKLSTKFVQFKISSNSLWMNRSEVLQSARIYFFIYSLDLVLAHILVWIQG